MAEKFPDLPEGFTRVSDENLKPDLPELPPGFTRLSDEYEVKPAQEPITLAKAVKAVAVGGIRGATTEFPGMVGGALEFASDTLGLTSAAKVGKSLKDWAEKAGDEWYGKAPTEGLERILYEGAKMLAPSAIPGGLSVSGLRALMGIGNLVKVAKWAEAAGNTVRAAELMAQATKRAKIANNLASVTVAGLFGLQQGQQTRDTALKTADDLDRAGNPEAARLMRESAYGLAPWLNVATEFGGEYVGTKYLGKLFGLDEAQIAKQGAKSVVQNFLARLGVGPTAAKLGAGAATFGKTLGVEVGTEMFQNFTEAGVEKLYGIRPDAHPLQEALDTVGPVTFMTMFMGGGALAAKKLSPRETVSLPDEIGRAHV
jgi:hypothetical protein